MKTRIAAIIVLFIYAAYNLVASQIGILHAYEFVAWLYVLVCCWLMWTLVAELSQQHRGNRLISMKIDNIFAELIKPKPLDPNDGNVKRAIRWYCEDNYISLFDWGVSEIGVTTLPDVIEVKVVLNRPELMIGKGGETIDGLRKHLEEILGSPVKWNIKECNPWSLKN